MIGSWGFNSILVHIVHEIVYVHVLINVCDVTGRNYAPINVKPYPPSTGRV